MNKENEFLIINFKGKQYKIIRRKLSYVISKLTDKKELKENELLNAMKNLGLYDEHFLENINSI